MQAKETVRVWIIKYNKGKDFRDYSEKSEVYTMTGKKKTDDEKLLIVKDYLDGDLTYAEIAEKYNVSYNNIYSWVQKYKTQDRKSTRLNSSHVAISYAVFCLKKKKEHKKK